MRNLISGFLASFSLLIGGWAGTELAADNIDDAIEILTASKGTIRKWDHRPEFVVVHDRPINRAAIVDTIAHMNDATGLEIAAPTFVDLTAVKLSDRFYRETNFTPRKMDNGNVEFSVTIATGNADTGQDPSATGNIVAFMMSAPFASHLIVASGFGRGGQSIARGYLKSPSHCFFEVRSNDKSIQFGRIFISSELDSKAQATCIYEEFTQTMGLVSDANGSEVFTYDNMATNKPRDHDRRLLSALYHPTIKYGDPVAKVIVLYERSAPQ